MTARRRLATICTFALLCQPLAPSIAETVTPNFQYELATTAGKEFTVVTVDFAPGEKADPHRHGQASVFAYVLSGEVRSQLAGEDARTYQTGESWFEPPGAHHLLTENTSRTAPARLLVVFVADKDERLKVND